jgi:hypothetical protein
MRHRTAPHHVQFDVTKAAPQVIAALHQGRVKVVAPEGIRPPFAAIVSPREFPGHTAHEPADLLPLLGINQQMNVIGRKAIIEQRHVAVLQVLSQALPVSIAVAGKLQQKGAIVTAMCNVENSARSSQPIRARHGRRIQNIEAGLTVEKRSRKMDLTPVLEANFYANVSFSGA